MKFYLILILTFTSISVFGQTVNFSLDGNAQYILPETYQSEDGEISRTSIRVLNDSLQERTTYNSTYTAIQEYTTKAGINVTGNIHIAITEKLNLKSGLGLSYLLFDSRPSVSWDPGNDEIINIDTISNAEQSIGGVLSQCDIFINNTGSSGPVKQEITHQLISLKIPIELEYTLLKDKFFVGVGGYLQTPLFTSVVSENHTIKMEEINGQTVCEPEKVVNKNTTGSSFSDLQIGIGGNFTYMFSKKIGFKVGVTKDINNIFNNPVSVFALTTNGVFKPLKFSFGFRYRFGGAYVRAKEIVEEM